MDKHYKYMVCTQCMTYNHESFIKQAMEGFVMQETTFPVVTVIVDDASTDKTQEIINAYMVDNFQLLNDGSEEKCSEGETIIFAQHRKNTNCYFAVIFLKENIYGKKSKRPFFSKWADNSKYFALCEGDDYWTNPNKLQTQVDFLEKNKNYILTCHRFKVFDYEENTWTEDGYADVFINGITGVSFDVNQRKKWLTKTLSLVFRADNLDEYYRFGNELDYILVYFLLKNGLGYCFNDFWGVYRKNLGGVCSKKPLNVKIEREYQALKALYFFDPSPITKRLYYDKYASVLLTSKGKVLLQEKFDLRKTFSVSFLIPLKIWRYIKKKW